MKKHYINGQEKSKIDSVPKCTVCMDGEILNDTPYRTHNELPAVKEIICLECESKYKQTRLTPVLPVHFHLSAEIYESQIEALNLGEKYLNKGSAPYIALKISADFDKEVKNMVEHYMPSGEILAQLREQYDKTGECKEHKWIESKPFRTTEGAFTIKNCMVCKQATMQYDGKNHSGTLTSLINFIVEQNQLHNDKAKKKIDLFSDVILNGINVKTNDINDAILTTKELPIVDKKPSLEELFFGAKKPDLIF